MEDEKITEEARTVLYEKEKELVKIIESLSLLSKSNEWNVYKELVFDKSTASLERQILSESLKPSVDLNKLYKLQGKHEQSREFGNIGGFVEKLKLQLANIKKRLQ